MCRRGGFTLLELLLVLFVAAVILTMSIRQYQRYVNRIDISGVQHDISMIKSALQQYFYLQGCYHGSQDNYGEFAGKNNNPSIVELGLSQEYASREPIISRFSTSIIKTGEKTKRKQPIYQLQLTAEVDATLPATKVQWLKAKLHAKEVQGHKLIWTFAPQTAVQAPELGDTLLFKQRGNSEKGSAVSGSYCA